MTGEPLTCWSCERPADPASPFCLRCGRPLLVGDRYRVIRQLGQPGGFGTAYEAADTAIERRVAVKVIDRPEDQRGSAKAELDRLKRVVHPGIVPLLDGSVEQGYLVTQLYQGDVRHYIQDHGVLGETEFLRAILPVVGGLRAAHREGIIHRDVKPANILYRVVGGHLELALADFGLARIEGSGPLSVVGTPGYLAPEVIGADPADYDATVDLFSLGVTFYEMLVEHWGIDLRAGLRAWEERDGRFRRLQRGGRLSQSLTGLIERMIAPATHRVPSALQVEHELQTLAFAKDSRFGRAATIDNDQMAVNRTYGVQNGGRSTIDFLNRASSHAIAVANMLRYEEIADDDERVVEHIAWIFAWAMEAATSLSFDVSSVIWLKYPARCPYCEHAACSCKTRPTLVEKQQMIIRIYGQGVARREVEVLPTSGYQQMFTGIYHRHNESMDRAVVAQRLAGEIMESMSLAQRQPVVRRLDLMVLAGQELADVFAWLFALVDKLGLQLQEVHHDQFGRGCPRCGRSVCGCTTVNDVVGDDWSLLIDGQLVDAETE